MTNSTQFGNDSNCSKFNGGNIATNCSRVKVFALDGLTKKHFGHYATLKNLFSQINKLCVEPDNQSLDQFGNVEYKIFLTVMKKKKKFMVPSHGIELRLMEVRVANQYTVAVQSMLGLFSIAIAEKEFRMFEQVAIVIHWDLNVKSIIL